MQLFKHLTLKRLEGKCDSPVPVIFPKMHFLESFYVTFNIIIGHIFPENFIEIPDVFGKYEDFLL